MKRVIAALLLAAAGSAAAGAVTYAFNDKGAIIHNGRRICVDWHGWTQHQLHGDQPYGDFPYSCDTP
jgi:Ni/Co efflux regulator RcnB